MNLTEFQNNSGNDHLSNESHLWVEKSGQKTVCSRGVHNQEGKTDTLVEKP